MLGDLQDSLMLLTVLSVLFFSRGMGSSDFDPVLVEFTRLLFVCLSQVL